ncbi:MAG: hypothetical protein M1546_25610, partial [Chloroflexi bacterium]|nr:hypothetical protein [Chloroflexota bacterium]
MSHNHHTPMMFRALFSPLIAVALAVSSVILIPSWAGRARAAGATLYVKPGGSTTGICDSWVNACDLSFALGDVAVSGDEIWVAAGTYKPSDTGDRMASFTLKSGVAVYGGFAVTETLREERDWDTNVVTLTGDLNDNGLDGNDSYHVVTSDNTVIETAILDGFTISGGNADDDNSATDDRGGGLFVSESQLAISNTVFISNSAVTAGGGMYIDRSNPDLENVTFRGNTAGEGGGMYNYQSSPTVKDATFAENSTTINLVAGGAGGGMYNTTSSPVLSNTTFISNTAEGGGGMANWNYSNPVLYNARFIDNSAGDGTGGGMYNLWGCHPELVNVIFIGNTANSGGGMYNDTNSSSNLVNATFTANDATSGGGVVTAAGSDATLANSILWDDGPSEIVASTGTIVTITYSLVGEACPTGVPRGAA